MEMNPNEELLNQIKKFFETAYRKDKDEYWTKLKPEHLTALALQLESVIVQKFISYERYREFMAPVVNLNDQLVGNLQNARDLIKFLYFERLKESDVAFNKRKGYWRDYIKETPELKQILDILDAIDIHDKGIQESRKKLEKNFNGGGDNG